MFAIEMTKEPTRSTNPTNHWGEVSIDLLGPMPNKDYILVVQE